MDDDNEGISSVERDKARVEEEEEGDSGMKWLPTHVFFMIRLVVFSKSSKQRI